jgi:low temperature requirement protein LtrA
MGAWIIGHLPITLAIAAAGAGMVSLIEHAHEPAAPEATAWLLAGSVAAVLLAQIGIARVLTDSERLPAVYRSLSLATAVAAVAALAAGALNPQPWILALSLGAILLILWFFAVMTFIRARAWPPAV